MDLGLNTNKLLGGVGQFAALMQQARTAAPVEAPIAEAAPIAHAVGGGNAAVATEFAAAAPKGVREWGVNDLRNAVLAARGHAPANAGIPVEQALVRKVGLGDKLVGVLGNLSKISPRG